MKWRALLERNGELSEERRNLMRDMERYAASVGCRHRHLVGYFGEPYERDACEACDYCLGELEPVAEPSPWRAKSCRASRAWGNASVPAHVANVLRGSETEQVARTRPRTVVYVWPAARLPRSTKSVATSISSCRRDFWNRPTMAIPCCG